MGIKEIRESGLLELYVIGDCTDSEVATVENAINQFPELKNDLYQIGASLEKYARISAIQPSEGLKEQFITEAKRRENLAPKDSAPQQLDKVSTVPKVPMWLGGLLAALSLLLGYLFFNGQSDLDRLQQEYDRYKIACDSIQQAAQIQYALNEQLNDPANTLLAMAATDKYSETDLFIIHNRDRQLNFLQVQNLPSITDDQSFQLWSIKEGQDPIPLTVFQGDEGFVVPIDFETDTNVYAITIETRGGATSPNLDNLIGTVNMPS